MSTITSQITGVSIVYSTICSGADQRKHKKSASLAFVRGIYRRPVNSPHKGPVTRKMFPFDDVIMQQLWSDKMQRQSELLIAKRIQIYNCAAIFGCVFNLSWCRIHHVRLLTNLGDTFIAVSSRCFVLSLQTVAESNIMDFRNVC